MSWQFLALRFGCPHSKDPKSRRAGTGGPADGTFKNLKTGATDSGGYTGSRWRIHRWSWMNPDGGFLFHHTLW